MPLEYQPHALHQQVGLDNRPLDESEQLPQGDRRDDSIVQRELLFEKGP